MVPPPESQSTRKPRLTLLIVSIGILVMVLFGFIAFLQRIHRPRQANPSMAFTTPSVATAQAISTRTPGFTFITLANTSNGDLTGQLVQEAAKARALGQRPFVLFSAGWCKSCKDVEDSLHESMVKEAVEGAYIIRLDIDEWQPHLGQTGFSVRMLPVFFRINDQGYPQGQPLYGPALDDSRPGTIAPIFSAYFSAIQ